MKNDWVLANSKDFLVKISDNVEIIFGGERPNSNFFKWICALQAFQFLQWITVYLLMT